MKLIFISFRPKEAFLFASLAGLSGISILGLGTNSLTAVLGWYSSCFQMVFAVRNVFGGARLW